MPYSMFFDLKGMKRLFMKEKFLPLKSRSNYQLMAVSMLNRHTSKGCMSGRMRKTPRW